jgi:phosphohistidine phosphatase
MKTLYLLRHAKAERDAPTGEDFDRPLAERGRSDAAALGRALSAADRRPDMILASTSRRTMETVENLTRDWPTTLVRTDRSLYLASAVRLLEAIRVADPTADSVMVVAHNPGIEELAIQLAHNVPSDPLRRMQKKYPTCALATFEVSANSWMRVSADLARLISFSTPKDLAEGRGA